MKSDDDYIVCPHCRENVDRRAPSCPYCGSDNATGWSDNTYLDGLDLPTEVDYDDLAEKEFGTRNPKRKAKFPWHAAIGIALLIAIVAILLRTLLQ